MARAHDHANRADESAARGAWLGPLHGLPFTVKDAIESGGMPSTGGAPALAGHVPDMGAPAVARLSAAGSSISMERPSLDIEQMFHLFLALTGAAAAMSIDPDTSDPSGMTLRQLLELHLERAGVRGIWSEWFSDHDVLLCPVLPMAAIAHDTSRPFMERTVLIDSEHVRTRNARRGRALVVSPTFPQRSSPLAARGRGSRSACRSSAPFPEDRTTLRAARLLHAVLGEWEPPPFAQT